MSRLDAVMNWVELARLAHYQVKELARRCHVSPNQLRKYFRQAFGKSPQEWMDELRLCLAEERLCSDRPPKEIAAELHFFDEAHLCREFKVRRGCNLEFLLQYRRSRQEQIDRLKETDGSFDAAQLPPPWKLKKKRLCQKIGPAYFGRRHA